MGYDPHIHHRRSIRLKEYDYSQAGWYYITVCTEHRVWAFGEIVDDEFVPSSVGAIILQRWRDIPKHFSKVELDAYVLMHNHFHGIIILGDEPLRNGPLRKGLINQTPTNHWPMMKEPSTTLGKIVRAFKARAAYAIHSSGREDFRWQRGFYEHVIRNDADLSRIRAYIQNNPLRWSLDEQKANNRD